MAWYDAFMALENTMFSVGDTVSIKNPPRDVLIGMELTVTRVSDYRVSVEGFYNDGVPIVLGVDPECLELVKKAPKGFHAEEPDEEPVVTKKKSKSVQKPKPAAKTAKKKSFMDLDFS